MNAAQRLFRGSPGALGDPEWAGLGSALFALGALIVLDIAIDEEFAISTAFLAAPFVSALRGGRRSTVAVAVLGSLCAAVSGAWNGNFGSLDYWLHVAVVIGSGWIAWLAARSVAGNRRSARRFQMLDDIAGVADGATSLEATVEAICDVIVPELADICLIDVAAMGGLERAAVRTGPAMPNEVAEQLADLEPGALERLRIRDSRAARTLVVENVGPADLAEISADPEVDAVLGPLRLRSLIRIPLMARGRVTGSLSLAVAGDERSYRDSDARFAGVLSGRVALALDNAGLFSDLERAERARTEIAQTLQRGLLPPPLPHVPGWSLAALYRPAGMENEVGGDFYDAFQIANGWMFVMGDVTGKGARAASITGQARYTLRTAAALTADPLVALATLNRALLSRSDAALCSVVAIAIPSDPGTPLGVAVAGHPPPLLVDGDEVIEVASPGPILGGFHDAAWALEQVRIEAGQQLVVITDGVTEACSPSGRFGEERLRAELAGAGSPSLAVQRVEAAMQGFAAGRIDDDAAILALAPGASDEPPLPGPWLGRAAGVGLASTQSEFADG